MILANISSAPRFIPIFDSIFMMSSLPASASLGALVASFSISIQIRGMIFAKINVRSMIKAI